MSLKDKYKKFMNHLEACGLPYAVWRGIKYFIFLIKNRRNHIESIPCIMISKEQIKLICAGEGVHIYWNNNEVTKGVGLNVAINTLGLWTDSRKAEWSVLEKNDDYMKIKIVFKELPLSQIWELAIDHEQVITWSIDTEIEEWLHLDEFRIACHVSPRYKTWNRDYQQSDFYPQDKRWHDVCLDGDPVSLVGVRFPLEGEFLPSCALEAISKEFLPLVQNLPLELNARIIGFRHISPARKKEYAPGYYQFFSGKINLLEEDYLLDMKIENLREDYLRRQTGLKTKTKKQKRVVKVLLANFPWQRHGKWGVRAGSRWPHIRDESEGDYLPFPFFLAYATSLLKKHGITATLIDAIAEQISEEAFLKMVSKNKFDYLVVETSIPSFYYDLYLLKKISTNGIPIILCGPNSEIFEPQFLTKHPFIDFVLCGEYEFTLLELITCLQEQGNLSKVRGIIYKGRGGIKKNPPREPFDINLLPWPEREVLPMHRYLDAPGEMRIPSVQMLASRGCPFKCQFCLWPQVMYNGQHYRAREVNNVVDEMEYLVRKEGFKSVYFDDDTFNVGKARMLQFCREIKKRGLDDVQWAIMARPDLMDEEILEQMKTAGLWAVKYGVESSVQDLVNDIGKNMDLKKSTEMIKFTKKLGIKTHLTFTFGLPGETRETIQKTIYYALRLDPFSIQFSITTPFPGTQYYKALEKTESIVSKDFSHYDGHFKSVIKLDNLTPEDLERAKKRAYRMWADHVRRKRGLKGDIMRFYTYSQTKGLRFALKKTTGYLRYLTIRRNKYLNLSEK